MNLPCFDTLRKPKMERFRPPGSCPPSDLYKIEATYKDGILKLVLPKTEESVPKKIEVH